MRFLDRATRFAIATDFVRNILTVCSINLLIGRLRSLFSFFFIIDRAIRDFAETRRCTGVHETREREVSGRRFWVCGGIRTFSDAVRSIRYSIFDNSILARSLERRKLRTTQVRDELAKSCTLCELFFLANKL